MNKPAAIYARVSSDRQKENHTIASQTAALIEYAQKNGYSVPPEWLFQDEGYSGAILVRPGLEALRDLAAEGQIAAVLVHSPDRLSRKYAYQVLLSEELSRCGVELIFLKAPAGATPEDQLLVQFQGMIAEYERAQIAERCRRGKKHMAQQGGVNVLSGAPYGYRYVRKSDTSGAFYEVMDAEARVVRMVFEMYTQQRLSINAIARLLNERQIATRTGKGRWERSTVWGMLRNPAYRGTACYGKTEQRPRQRITRPLRQRKALPSRDVGGHERPRAEWIEVPVPALVNEETFALAQEQLEKNKRHSPRRTVEPTLLQGMLVCEQCGYGMYRTSTHTSKQKLNYYRCIGSDGYRRLNGPLCTNRPVRQDYLDAFVWSEIMRLLEDPGLIQTEIDRRREAAKKADPLRKREEELRREQARVEKSSERLVTAYQEGLLTLPQLRQRMPALQKQTQAVESELHSLKMASVDETKYLQLAESLAGFRSKLRLRAEVLDIEVRQQILRLLVKEVLVGGDTITLRHSIPFPQAGTGSSGSPAPPPGVTGSRQGAGYLLRSGSDHTALRRPFLVSGPLPAGSVPARFHHHRLQPHPDQTQYTSVCHPMPQTRQQLLVRDRIEVGFKIGVVHRLTTRLQMPADLLQRLMRIPPRPETVRTVRKIRFENRLQHQQRGHLHHPVPDRRNPQRPQLAIRLRDVHPPHRLRLITLCAQLFL
jgi:site-specific DNA recombinase